MEKNVFLYNTKTGMLVGFDVNLEIYNRDFVRVNAEEKAKLRAGATYQDILAARSNFLAEKEQQAVAANISKLNAEKKGVEAAKERFSVGIDIDAKSAANMAKARSDAETLGIGERPFADVDFDTVTVEYLNGVKDFQLIDFGKYVLHIDNAPMGKEMSEEAKKVHLDRIRADFKKMIANLERKRAKQSE